MITLKDIRTALSLPDFNPYPAHARMAPVPRIMRPPEGVIPHEAGVLVLLYPDADDWQIVLTRRNQRLRGHSGQISFPGGKRDPRDASFAETVLRETCEELGLCDQNITIMGSLSPIYIPPSNFQVHPTVAVVSNPPGFNPNPDEVAEVFTFPIRDLLDQRNQLTETREIQGYQFEAPYYLVKGHKVWGATAIMLSELEHRLRAVMNNGFHAD